MVSGIRTIVGELRHRFERVYGDRLVNLILFGSQARGDAEPGSDIDVLVVLKGPVDSGEEIHKTIDIVAELSLRNDQVITCVFMDEERYLRGGGPLLRNIQREGIAV